MKSNAAVTIHSTSSSPLAGKTKIAAKRHDAATGLAIAALRFMAAAPEELSRFLALTGIAPEAIRAAAAEPGFLGGVVAFAAHAGIAPEEVEKARIVLAGADWKREVP
jgi:hypothetical protein